MTAATTIDAAAGDAPQVTTTTMTILPVETGAVCLEPTVKGWDEEVEQMLHTLDAVEKKVKIIKESLGILLRRIELLVFFSNYLLFYACL